MAAARKCQKCAAEIPPQDINQGRAGFLSGHLLCAACVQKKREAIAAAKAQAKRGHSAAAPATKQAVAAESKLPGSDSTQARTAVAEAPPPPAEEAPIPLVGGAEDKAVGTSSRIKRSGEDGGMVGMAFDDSKLRRPVTLTGKGATRCRVFHSRLNDGALGYMIEHINEWVDNNEIEIKQAQSTVGVFAGKTAEQHLIITIFY